jgi:hypothetical protein
MRIVEFAPQIALWGLWAHMEEKCCIIASLISSSRIRGEARGRAPKVCNGRELLRDYLLGWTGYSRWPNGSGIGNCRNLCANVAMKLVKTTVEAATEVGATMRCSEQRSPTPIIKHGECRCTMMFLREGSGEFGNWDTVRQANWYPSRALMDEQRYSIHIDGINRGHGFGGDDAIRTLPCLSAFSVRRSISTKPEQVKCSVALG